MSNANANANANATAPYRDDDADQFEGTKPGPHGLPVQGTHGPEGSRPGRQSGDGGTGLGCRPPAGWPDYGAARTAPR
jgi:hypothetical protein